MSSRAEGPITSGLSARVRGRRISRRRALGLGATGIAGFWLAGCSTAESPPTPIALATTAPTPVPTAGTRAGAATAAPRPKLGGTLRPAGSGTVRNLEPHLGGFSGIQAWGPHVCYNRLMTFKWGPDVKPPSYIPIGDLAESWSQPDDLTFIFKLRPGVKFHNVAPVNGRELAAEDIAFSLQRVIDQKTFASILSGVAKMEAVDK